MKGGEPDTDQTLMRLSDDALITRFMRIKGMLQPPNVFNHGGGKLRAYFQSLESEMRRRMLLKEAPVCGERDDRRANDVAELRGMVRERDVQILNLEVQVAAMKETARILTQQRDRLLEQLEAGRGNESPTGYGRNRVTKSDWRSPLTSPRASGGFLSTSSC